MPFLLGKREGRRDVAQDMLGTRLVCKQRLQALSMHIYDSNNKCLLSRGCEEDCGCIDDPSGLNRSKYYNYAPFCPNSRQQHHLLSLMGQVMVDRLYRSFPRRWNFRVLFLPLQTADCDADALQP